MTTGDKIRFHRKQLGMTQTELGERLGVQVNAVSKWECGRVEAIPTSKIKELAKIFNVTTSYLIDDEKGQPPVTEELSDAKKQLIQYAYSLADEQVTDEQAALALRILKSVLEAAE